MGTQDGKVYLYGNNTTTILTLEKQIEVPSLARNLMSFKSCILKQL